MAILDEGRSSEYPILLADLREAERGWQIGWTTSVLASCTLLAWGIVARNPGLMIPVVLAAAVGHTCLFRGRREARLIAGYLATYGDRNLGGVPWFSRVRRLSSVPGFTTENDWLLVGLENVLTACAAAMAWWFAADARRGEILAGIVTGACIVFLYHSVSQFAQMRRTTDASVWRHAENLSAQSGSERSAAA